MFQDCVLSSKPAPQFAGFRGNMAPHLRIRAFACITVQSGEVKAKAKKQQCCAAWMWSWIIVFFAIIGMSDYARVRADRHSWQMHARCEML